MCVQDTYAAALLRSGYLCSRVALALATSVCVQDTYAAALFLLLLRVCAVRSGYLCSRVAPFRIPMQPRCSC
eukprot:gene5540-8922_t